MKTKLTLKTAKIVTVSVTDLKTGRKFYYHSVNDGGARKRAVEDGLRVRRIRPFA